MHDRKPIGSTPGLSKDTVRSQGSTVTPAAQDGHTGTMMIICNDETCRFNSNEQGSRCLLKQITVSVGGLCGNRVPKPS